MALKTAKCAYFLPKCHAYGVFKHLLMGLFFYQNAMPTAFYEAKDVNILIQTAFKRSKKLKTDQNTEGTSVC